MKFVLLSVALPCLAVSAHSVNDLASQVKILRPMFMGSGQSFV